MDEEEFVEEATAAVEELAQEMQAREAAVLAQEMQAREAAVFAPASCWEINKLAVILWAFLFLASPALSLCHASSTLIVFKTSIVGL